jgi:hypothetical protein
MFDKNIVYKALRQSMKHDSSLKRSHNTDLEEASLISLLIHDIFGGEILKTHMKRGWHFYNRIEGNRIDFTSPDLNKPAGVVQFEDIPSTPDETYSYFEDVEYSDFLMRFLWAFEEAIGLDKYKPGLSA